MEDPRLNQTAARDANKGTDTTEPIQTPVEVKQDASSSAAVESASVSDSEVDNAAALLGLTPVAIAKDHKMLIKLLGNMDVRLAADWTTTRAPDFLQSADFDERYCHHFVVGDNPFLSKSWVLSWVDDCGISFQSLHDPRSLAEALRSVELWKTILGRIHRGVGSGSKMLAFSEYPAIKALLSQMDDNGRQSFFKDENCPMSTYFVQGHHWLDMAAENARRQLHTESFIQLWVFLLTFHDAILKLEVLLRYEEGLFDHFACKYGAGESLPVDVQGGPMVYFSYEKFTGRYEDFCALMVKKLEELRVVYDSKNQILTQPSDLSAEITYWYHIRPSEAGGYSNATLYIVPVQNTLNRRFVEVRTYKSKLPLKLLRVADSVSSAWSDKKTFVSYIIAFGVIALLITWIYKVWKNYRKAKGRDFWKHLMSNKAQAHQKHRSSIWVTGIYCFTTVAAIIAFMSDGLKTAHNVASSMMTLASMFTKTEKGLSDVLGVAEEEEEDEEDEIEEEGKKRKIKIIRKKTNKAHGSSSWDGRYLPDMLAYLSNINMCHNGSEPENRVPLIFREHPGDTWQYYVRLPFRLLFRFLGFIFLTVGAWVVAYPIIWYVFVIGAFFAGIVFLWCLWRLVRRWWVRRSERNLCHRKKDEDAKVAVLLQEGNDLVREYCNHHQVDSQWIHRYAKYIFNKTRIGLPLDDKEVEFSKLFDVRAAAGVAANRAERGGNTNKKRDFHKRYDNGDVAVDDIDDDPYADDDDAETAEHKYLMRMQAQEETRRARKTNPQARPPGQGPHINRGRGHNLAEGISKGVKVEEALISIATKKKIDNLLRSFVQKGYRNIPAFKWERYAFEPKQYMADMIALHGYCTKHNITVGAHECPICSDPKMSCQLYHVSLMARPESQLVLNKAEAMTFEHPRKFDIGAAEALLKVEVVKNGKTTSATGVSSSSGVIMNYHTIHDADEIRVKAAGSGVVVMKPSEFIQLKRDGKPVDVVVAPHPKTLNVYRLPVRPVTEPAHLGSLTVLTLERLPNGDLRTPHFSAQHGTAVGSKPTCPEAVLDGATFPCGRYIGTYPAEPGDSGCPVFDNFGNFIGIHCSGHASNEYRHNHFETFAGLGLPNVKVPLN